jgi:muramoyltetrapeptide carboxypeptidase
MSWLSPGSKIEVVAPGFVSTEEDIEGASRFLKRWSLVANIPENIIGNDFLCSGSLEQRYLHLSNALNSKDSRVIWCLRGGYGAIQLLPLLKKMKKPKTKKLLIGISDITSLHVFLNQEWGWPTLHASLLDRVGAGKLPHLIEEELRKLLFTDQTKTEFRSLQPLNKSARIVGEVDGVVVGGNLTVLQSTLGTPYQFNLKNKILAIEDLGERGYRIDRIFEQFEQAGIFKGCRGLVIGEFLGGDEPDGKAEKWSQVFTERAAKYSFPVFKGLEIGHGTVQRPLFLGVKAHLKTGRTGCLTVQSARS